jgi:hypothetical protein
MRVVVAPSDSALPCAGFPQEELCATRVARLWGGARSPPRISVACPRSLWTRLAHGLVGYGRGLVRIDHVIYATADLEVAAARLEGELGLPALVGGRHEGLGTHNRIVPLGGGYLELLAVADPAEAAGSRLGRALQARIARAPDRGGRGAKTRDSSRSSSSVLRGCLIPVQPAMPAASPGSKSPATRLSWRVGSAAPICLCGS